MLDQPPPPFNNLKVNLHEFKLGEEKNMEKTLSCVRNFMRRLFFILVFSVTARKQNRATWLPHINIVECIFFSHRNFVM